LAVANNGIVMIGEAMSGYCLWRFCTTLAKIKLNDWNALMALSGSKRVDGIADKTSLANYGNKQK